MPFTHAIRVRYADVDAQRVVFNAHWLTFFDDAMTRYLDHLGYDPKETWTEGGEFDVMLRRAVMEWEGPAGFDDVVDVAVVPTRLGTTSFDLTFEARVQDRRVTRCTTTYVVIEPGAHRSRRLPDHFRERLARDLDESAAVR